MTADHVIKETENKMHKTIEAVLHEFNSVRTGRANSALLDTVKIDYYGTPTPVNQVGSITTPDSHMLVIQPWEKNLIPAIEKAIREANLGLNPSNDGNLIRVPIPQLNEERRAELAKLIKKYGEEGKVAIRNVRREANEKLKKLEKSKDITEDDLRDYEKTVQTMTDKYVKEIDEHVSHKEKEIFEV